MAKVSINIHSGPELKNKATLGLLVAVTAQKKGMMLKFFLLQMECISYELYRKRRNSRTGYW